MPKPSIKNIRKEEFLVGAANSLSNSFELFDDGAILKERNRKSRAYTLFQLSMEEAGKVILLLDGFTMLTIHEKNEGFFDESQINSYYKRLDKIFYDHSNKTKYIIEYELLSLNRYIEVNNCGKDAGICKQRDEVQNDLGNLKLINDLKNVSLYTSIENDSFIKPSAKIDSTTLSTIENKAFSKLMLTKAKSLKFLKRQAGLLEIDLNKLETMRLYDGINEKLTTITSNRK